MSTIEQAYKAANTYQDLCDINVKFLEGVYDHTAYHGSPVCSETIPLLGDLRKLNALGMHTLCGQPTSSAFTEVESSDARVKLLRCHQQRAYMEGFVENKHTHALKEYLDKSDTVYYSILYPDNNRDTNFPYGKEGYYPLHREAHITLPDTKELYDHIEDTIVWTEGLCGGAAIGDWVIDDMEDKEFLVENGVKESLLDDCAVVVLAVRDYKSPVSLEKLMIDFFTV